MKKLLVVLVAVIGFTFGANAQSAVVEKVSSSISGSTVTISVKVLPTFTPTEHGLYRFIVSPEGTMRNILNSTSQETTIGYGAKGWDFNGRIVYFTCSVEDNSYRQCRTHSFSVSVYPNR